MHELSIAQSMIDMACELATREGAHHIIKLRARIGLLSGVAKTALQFSFDLAAEGTACEGAVLEIEDVPVTVMCPQCNAAQELQVIYCFCCPVCGTPTPQILTGQELEVVSVELADNHDDNTDDDNTADAARA
jgi:hydrogenase nickel incorporation protein HypA/HybF